MSGTTGDFIGGQDSTVLTRGGLTCMNHVSADLNDLSFFANINTSIEGSGRGDTYI